MTLRRLSSGSSLSRSPRLSRWVAITSCPVLLHWSAEPLCRSEAVLQSFLSSNEMQHALKDCPWGNLKAE